MSGACRIVPGIAIGRKVFPAGRTSRDPIRRQPGRTPPWDLALFLRKKDEEFASEAWHSGEHESRPSPHTQGSWSCVPPFLNRPVIGREAVVLTFHLHLQELCSWSGFETFELVLAEGFF